MEEIGQTIHMKRVKKEADRRGCKRGTPGPASVYRSKKKQKHKKYISLNHY